MEGFNSRLEEWEKVLANSKQGNGTHLIREAQREEKEYRRVKIT